MPPRALIGRRQRPSRLDILVARGFSYQLNPRNIEYDWYPAWTHALQKALPSRSDVALTAQYCTWISPQDQAGAGDEEEPDSESEDEPDEDWEDDEAGMDDEDSDHDSEFMDLGDPEDGSSPPMDDEDEIPSDDTIPAGPETRSQIIDFAILKLATEQLDDVEKHPDGTPRSFIVTNSDVEAIVEIKRYMSRRIPYTRTEILKELGKAQAQLILQAAHIFAQSDSQYVRAIAAAGPYWQSSIIRRNPHGPPGAYTMDTLHQYLEDGVVLTQELVDVESINWNVPLRLGHPRSNQRLDTLKANLAHL